MSTRNRALPGLIVGLLGIAAGYAIFKAFSGPERRTQERVRATKGDAGREFAVMYSAFGAPFKHAGDDPEKPEAPFKTLAEAREIAERWELTATAVQGKAQIVNVRTGELVGLVNQSA